MHARAAQRRPVLRLQHAPGRDNTRRPNATDPLYMATEIVIRTCDTLPRIHATATCNRVSAELILVDSDKISHEGFDRLNGKTSTNKNRA